MATSKWKHPINNNEIYQIYKVLEKKKKKNRLTHGYNLKIFATELAHHCELLPQAPTPSFCILSTHWRMVTYLNIKIISVTATFLKKQLLVPPLPLFPDTLAGIEQFMFLVSRMKVQERLLKIIKIAKVDMKYSLYLHQKERQRMQFLLQDRELNNKLGFFFLCAYCLVMGTGTVCHSGYFSCLFQGFQD